MMVSSSIPPVQSPGVCVLLVALSLCLPFTWNPWEGESWRGKQPPRAGPCLVTERRLMPPRGMQDTEPGHCHGPGQLWPWCPPHPTDRQHRLCSSSTCPVLLLQENRCPHVCQRLSNRETHEMRRGGCRYPLSLCHAVTRARVRVDSSQPSTL